MYKGKKVVVLGLGKSGWAAIRVLKKLGALVIGHDHKKTETPEEVDVELKYGEEEVITSDIDVVVKSPGIPYNNKHVQQAFSLHIPVITEVELAYQVTNVPFIGITGSNGKTTTTTLVGEIIKQDQQAVLVGGNIGTPLSQQAYEAKEEKWMVAELSSFQLMGIETFQPKIACLMNIYPAHLDYHGTIEEYIDAKSKLFQNQTKNDLAVLNADSPYTKPIEEKIQSSIYYFSTKKEVAKGAYVEGNELMFKDETGKKTSIISVDKIVLKGEHNLENILASIVITILAGVKVESIVKVLTRFSGVEHRLEFVENQQGVSYYNDSKATNPEACSRALRSFHEPILHIAGGLNRGIDFHELIDIYEHQSIKRLFAYGESKDMLASMAEKANVKVTKVNTLAEAVQQAKKMATSGDVVLLSPACASWDQYASFEERGKVFKEEVKRKG